MTGSHTWRRTSAEFNRERRRIPIMQMEEHHVFFTISTGATLLDAMGQLEPWLNGNDIRPIEFKHTVTSSGAIELQLTFRSRHEASLFEQAFCRVSLI
jgi:hypothetical protein